MKSLQICSFQPVHCDCCSNYKGIGFDGNHFYFTNPDNCEIHKYDMCFQKIQCIPVCREYTSICFDSFCNCFWALACKEPNRIFKLDCCLMEIDCIAVTSKDCCYMSLTGLSCQEENYLLICGSFGIGKVPKCGDSYVKMVERSCPGLQYTAVEWLGDEFLKSFYITQSHVLELDSECDSEQIQQHLPESCYIEDMALCRCFCNDCDSIYVLVTKKDCYSYLLRCTVCCLEEEFPCVPCPEPTPISCHESAANIMESIALTEASLSHILNAEGEKIQKIIAVTDCPDEIINVNDAVNKTIISITHLEQVLYAKLQIAQEICNKKESCDCPSTDDILKF